MLHRPTHPVPSQGTEPQKVALEENHHSTPRTGPPANATPKSQEVPQQPTDWAPKPGTEIQGNPNDPESAEKPAPAPDNPLDPNPSPDPNQKARSLSRASDLRWQTANRCVERPQAYLR
ncbi:hypothetical protein CHARACLAT_031682 [Characodon lateralis]|uniref:Uncharacterized protein n=1 Tax=Characodon lateralis TaxID=208331 RepID=A0ABU7DXI6_9TELE|nr:hypothetical protein [Characodon lateralis]